jgi:hypothetical protein
MTIRSVASIHFLTKAYIKMVLQYVVVNPIGTNNKYSCDAYSLNLKINSNEQKHL